MTGPMLDNDGPALFPKLTHRGIGFGDRRRLYHRNRWFFADGKWWPSKSM